jgi:hypothetical protein
MSAEKPPVPPSEPKPKGAPESTPKTDIIPYPALTSEEEVAALVSIRERLAANTRAENGTESARSSESRESVAKGAETSIEARKNKSEKPKAAHESKEGHAEKKHNAHEKGHGKHGHGHEAFKPYSVRDYATAGAAVGLMIVGGGMYEGLIAPSIINFLGLKTAVISSLNTVGLGAGFLGVGSALGLYLLWNFGKELWKSEFWKELPFVGGALGSGGGGGKKAAPKKASGGGGGGH